MHILDVGGKKVATPVDVRNALIDAKKDGQRNVLIRLKSDRCPNSQPHAVSIVTVGAFIFTGAASALRRTLHVRLGLLADKPSATKTQLCPLLPQ
jgi:hypothetical protein